MQLGKMSPVIYLKCYQVKQVHLTVSSDHGCDILALFHNHRPFGGICRWEVFWKNVIIYL